MIGYMIDAWGNRRSASGTGNHRFDPGVARCPGGQRRKSLDTSRFVVGVV